MDWDVFDVRTCRGCGCTDEEACWPPCFWVDQAWCSACEFKVGRRLTLVGAVLAFVSAGDAIAAGALMSGGHRDGALAIAVVMLVMVTVGILLGRVGKKMLEDAS